MEITTVGLDLAKDVFQVHGITGDGDVAFNKTIRRAQLSKFFADLPPCLVGMEACGSSHYWGREISKLGHDVKLMPAFYVKPYVKRGKTDTVPESTWKEIIQKTCQSLPTALLPHFATNSWPCKSGSSSTRNSSNSIP